MLTQTELKRLLHYDPEIGIFTWKCRVARCVMIGDIAGRINSRGYITIWVNYKKYSAHRLAWLYMKGFWPIDCLDHINRIKHDNRWCNLRESTNKENGQNRSLSKNNSTGFTGVYFRKKINKYEVSIQVNGSRKFIGLYSDINLAAYNYDEAKKKYHTFNPVMIN